MYMNLYCFLIFIPMLFISSMMIFISNSWFTNWMIMEINLMIFLMLLIFEKKNKSDIVLNYFLIQSFNSYIYLMSSINLNFSQSNLNSLMLIFMNLAMLTKIGFPPFHLWYLKILKNLNWFNLFLISTVQKIIPLMILNNFIIEKNYLINLNMLIILISSFICSIMGIQTMNLKILLAYSSIIQMGWIILILYINEMMSLNYFFVYSIIMYSMIYIFKIFNLNNLNNLNNLKFIDNKMFLLLMMIIFSLASIPPTLGFLMKWISIQTIYFNLSNWMIMAMIFNSLISMYFYIRIMNISLMIYYNSMKFNFLMINFNMKLNSKKLFMIWISIIMLYLYEII